MAFKKDIPIYDIKAISHLKREEFLLAVLHLISNHIKSYAFRTNMIFTIFYSSQKEAEVI